MPGHVEGLNGNSELPFSLSETIRFCSVKEVDSVVPGSSDAVSSELLCILGVRIDPVAIADS